MPPETPFQANSVTIPYPAPEPIEDMPHRFQKLPSEILRKILGFAMLADDSQGQLIGYLGLQTDAYEVGKVTGLNLYVEQDFTTIESILRLVGGKACIDMLFMYNPVHFAPNDTPLPGERCHTTLCQAKEFLKFVAQQSILRPPEIILLDDFPSFPWTPETPETPESLHILASVQALIWDHKDINPNFINSVQENVCCREATLEAFGKDCRKDHCVIESVHLVYDIKDWLLYPFVWAKARVLLDNLARTWKDVPANFQLEWTGKKLLATANPRMHLHRHLLCMGIESIASTRPTQADVRGWSARKLWGVLVQHRERLFQMYE
ncbi:MAG: hypothetical protein M1820_005085 [Bogoriella megaspora]|nr:MAG: hypothetical protein M1820_005085 [Bogoriella megaspora]